MLVLFRKTYRVNFAATKNVGGIVETAVRNLPTNDGRTRARYRPRENDHAKIGANST